MNSNDLTLFKQFAPKAPQTFQGGNNAVIYTRVSSADQEDNTSLASQKKHCEIYADKKGFNIVGYFGGTYESAKTDDRKEFNRMLSFVKRSKNINYVIVYSYERFSRSGINGASIADELLKKIRGCYNGSHSRARPHNSRRLFSAKNTLSFRTNGQ